MDGKTAPEAHSRSAYDLVSTGESAGDSEQIKTRLNSAPSLIDVKAEVL